MACVTPVAAPARTAARRRVLFVGGSLNQTTMLHRVARELYEHECVFAPFYADGLLRLLAERRRLDFTTLGGRAKAMTEAYLREQDLPVDPRGASGPYDLVVMGTDLVVLRNVRGRPLVLVQEGMMDPEDWRYHLVRALRLPRFLANTSMTGLSGAYDAFCVASSGYRDLFVGKGAPRDRIHVTGIPNFDDAASFVRNDFPHRGYVLGVTSCLRETLKPEDRPAFIRRCLAIAGPRPLAFKLHPNEDWARARREIAAIAPRALVFAEGNTNHMVANAVAVVTRYSSVVYVALALGKEVHADVDIGTLRALLPVQNGGTSAHQIAQVCRRLLG